MRSNGVTVAVTQEGPDGVTTVLPPDLWRERLARLGLGGDHDEELEAAAYDLLWWDEDHYTVTGRSVCADCQTSFQGPNVYCSVHRCRARNSKGRPCTKAAHERHACMFCVSHGCIEVLGGAADGLTVYCPEQAERGSRKCSAHQPTRAGEPTRHQGS